MRGDAGFPVRLRFTKHGPVRFISHRDIARAFERAFRVSELPIAFTQGFSPRPKVSFGPALAVGYESDAEYLDVELTHEVDVTAMVEKISVALPEGVRTTGVIALADRAPALQDIITSLSYRVRVTGVTHAVLARTVGDFDRQAEVPVTVSRKGAPVLENIRPSVLGLAAREEPTADAARVLELEVTTRPRSLRVADVVAGLRTMSDDATALVDTEVVRTHQWIERGGARQEPLDVDRRSPVPEVHSGAVPRALEACA